MWLGEPADHAEADGYQRPGEQQPGEADDEEHSTAPGRQQPPHRIRNAGGRADGDEHRRRRRGEGEPHLRPRHGAPHPCRPAHPYRSGIDAHAPIARSSPTRSGRDTPEIRRTWCSKVRQTAAHRGSTSHRSSRPPASKPSVATIVAGRSSRLRTVTSMMRTSDRRRTPPPRTSRVTKPVAVSNGNNAMTRSITVVLPLPGRPVTSRFKAVSVS